MKKISPFAAYFVNKDAKQKSYVMNMCPGKLKATKKAQKQEEQNGSVKPSGEDPTVVKEEPQLEPKLLENKTVDSSKNKLKTPPVSSRMLRGGSKKKLFELNKD